MVRRDFAAKPPPSKDFNETPYTDEFFGTHEAASHQSAEIVIPIVLNLVPVNSVIDVGCGTGAWLSVFRQLGVADVWGADGDWVNLQRLLIPRDRFLPVDLTQPLLLNRNFDLVVSLEVAEHLPPEVAETFVGSLTKLGRVVLFSAAIPFQGGTLHLNERWPDYWVELFKNRGYEVIDCIRRHVWSDSRVDWWYAQNTLLFAEAQYVQENKLLTMERERTRQSQLSVVHPRHYLAQQATRLLSARQLVIEAIRLLKKKMRLQRDPRP